MNAVISSIQLPSERQELERLNFIFKKQKSFFKANPYRSAEQRLQDLKRLKTVLLKYQEKLIKAVDQDFNGRSADETRIAELMTSVQSINYTLKHLRRWMRPSKRHVSLLFTPSHNQVMYQPLGTIGIMVPWNYPIQLAIVPLMTALAAGSTAMIKMSEFTPATNAMLKRVLAEEFSEDQVAIIEGEIEVSSVFSSLPWDHLIFTGSTTVGRSVMRAAAKNLTPVTLELGGKSPALITPKGNLKDAVERICFGKSLNAGQTCIAPDYVLIPADREEEFVQLYKETFARLYPSLRNNSDYTAIINPRQHQRLQQWIQDARSKGARITLINPKNESFEGTRKMPLHIVQDGTEDMSVMQEELFGPILPLVPYQQLDEAIHYINERARPLALYLFTYNTAEQKIILEHTHAGGVSINDTLMHIAQDDLPFGGIGPSGMGHYHGKEGFIALSHAKAIHRKGKFNSGKFIYPPYGGVIQKMIHALFIR